MIVKQPASTRRTLKDLQKILLDVLHSDSSFERDDLFARVARCFPKQISFSVVLVEARRFSLSKTDTRSERLYLPFLSLRIARGKFKPFNTPEELATLVDKSRASGGVIWEHAKSVVVSTNDVGDFLKAIEISEQIILSYYYACGHYDNFMANASRRFAKKYLQSQHSLSISQVMNAIRTQTSCEVVYLQYDIDTSELTIVDDIAQTYPKIAADFRFQTNLQLAVIRRGTFSGQTKAYNYVINVAAMERSYDSLIDADRSTVKTGFGGQRIRHALILCKYNRPLSMDSIKFGPHLFNIQLGNDAFSVRERLIFDIYRRVSVIERRFSAEPVERRAQIVDLIHEQFDRIAKAATKVTAAQLVIIRIYNPFANALEAVVVVSEQSAVVKVPPVVVGASSSNVAECFRSGQTQHCSSFPSYTEQIERSDDKQKAGFVFPIVIGCVTRGTIECYSTRRAQLQYDEEYLTAISHAIGDAARRLEASADIAWISRLSFLHSARHELENFLPLLKAHDEELHSSLRNTLRRYSGIGPAPWRRTSRETLAEKVRGLLLEAVDHAEHTEQLVKNIETIEDIFEPDDGFQFLLGEVFSTLLSNAKKHSAVRAADFGVEFERAEGSVESILIRYRCRDKRIRPERAQRVGTSPIPDARHNTYHYGLFLVSAQVRMNGGAVYVNTGGPVELDTIPFEICFSLPLYPLGASDAD